MVMRGTFSEVSNYVPWLHFSLTVAVAQILYHVLSTSWAPPPRYVPPFTPRLWLTVSGVFASFGITFGHAHHLDGGSFLSLPRRSVSSDSALARFSPCLSQYDPAIDRERQASLRVRTVLVRLLGGPCADPPLINRWYALIMLILLFLDWNLPTDALIPSMCVWSGLPLVFCLKILSLGPSNSRESVRSIHSSTLVGRAS